MFLSVSPNILIFHLSWLKIPEKLNGGKNLHSSEGNVEISILFHNTYISFQPRTVRKSNIDDDIGTIPQLKKFQVVWCSTIALMKIMSLIMI